MAILTQFVLRLSFGLALGMALADPRKVTSGYYRNHLYVLLGLNVLATMVALGSEAKLVFVPPLAAAVASYLGAVAWLYEKPRAGIALLVVVAAASLWGAWADTTLPADATTAATVIALADPPTGGFVLGFTMAAMFLGHWYLNSPSMAIAPLQRLIVLMMAAIVLRAAVEGAGLAVRMNEPTTAAAVPWAFIALRWLAGIVGALATAVMASATLKIPNTQSATGILYVGVIVTFIGELTALLLAAQWT